MTDYHLVRVDTPPILRQRDGKWFAVVIHGGLEIEAPIGKWFAAEFMVRIVIPQVFPLDTDQGAPSGNETPPPVPEGKG